MKGTKKSKKLPVEVTQDEFIKILEVTNKLHHKIAFLLARESGMRVSEVIALQPEDIDIENKRIRVNQGKGGKDRIVPLPPSWMPHLMKYIPIQCSKRAVQRAFEIYSKKAGITEYKPTVHFHSLRHGFATHMARNGARITSIQMLLGHNDVATTSVYLRLSPEEALADHRKVF